MQFEWGHEQIQRSVRNSRGRAQSAQRADRGVVATHLANADTSNYKARDPHFAAVLSAIEEATSKHFVRFSSCLCEAAGRQAALARTASASMSMPLALARGATARIHQRIPSRTAARRAVQQCIRAGGSEKKGAAIRTGRVDFGIRLTMLPRRIVDPRRCSGVRLRSGASRA